tara:strand:+ start:7147 stop:11664 length:4518 start_codon:yes stop_codon:yes gene_type:complete
MQQTYKHSFTDSKMQKDLDARLVSPREYRDAVNVAVSRSEGADVGALENILGNKFLSSLQYPNATAETRFYIIGWYIDEDQDKIYTFVTNYKDNSPTKLESTAGPLSYHSIVETDVLTGNSNILVSGSFLNFSANSPINHVDQIETLLFWTDNRNQPRQINVTTARANPIAYNKESDVSVAKYYPYKPIKIKREFSLTNCVFTSRTEAASITTPGYDAWYDYFILEDTPSQDVIDNFIDNIGAKGYAEDSNGNKYEFRVAFFQQAGFDPETAGVALNNAILPAPFDSSNNVPGNPNRPYLLFIDRALSTSVFPRWDGVNNPIPANNKYNITLFQENNKDISSAWKQEDQFKLTCYNEDFSGPGIGVQLLPDGATYASLIPSMFYFGTRSCPNTNINGVSASGYSAWASPPSSTFSTFEVFRVLNAFPNNTTQSGTFPAGVEGKNSYLRVTHPKIPKQRYVVCTFLLTAPVIPSATPDKLIAYFGEYTKLRNGELQFVRLYTEFGITDNDVLSFHLPNKFYNQDFPGDPAFLEDKFVRFAYRYKFNDGEYSLLSPFTQSIFIPKQGGYFQKYVGTNKQSASNNDVLNQEQEAGENTIVNFLTNEVTEVALDIPLPTQVNKLKSILKVDEIEIVYKESTALALKVVEKLSLNDFSSNTNKFLTYVYQSRRPIKTLPDSVITRVYDKVPIRAATQASAGNRIIYGNFLDAHTSPLTLDYLVGVSAKFTPAFNEYNGSDIAYPNHTLKQNRTYQVGIVLQDKYGRSSDVILSSIRDTSYEENSGPFANNPCVFGGSTIYSPYFDNVTEPDANGTNMQNPRTGLVDWPGDSLKVLFANTIPNVISTNEGYPGLYDNLITILEYSGAGASDPGMTGLFSMGFSSSVGFIEDVKVGNFIQWLDTSVDTEYEFEIAAISVANNTLYVKDNVDVSFPGVISPNTRMNIMERNENGFYSYKMVVKQTEQEFYNVYLPSLLNGKPIIKPFKLEVSGTFGTGTVNNTVTNPAADPRTFLLLEGMNFTVGGTEFTITNILNDENFVYTPATSFTSTPNVEFFTKSSKNIINVTTLLTDNANKVPPGLIETTPVQQQYSPSNTTLYPRVAIQEGYTATNPFYTGVTSQNIPIFPGRSDMKVRAVGNFFALNTDANTAGLYEAKSDPPSANIENTFRLGRDAETVKPDSIEPLVFTAYETNPVKSAIEIYWETGTSGLIRDLNNSILDDTTVPFALSQNLEELAYSESMDRTGAINTRRIGAPFQILNINSVVVPITSAKSISLVDITNQDGSLAYNVSNSVLTLVNPTLDPTLPANTLSICQSFNNNLYFGEVAVNNFLKGILRVEVENPLLNIYDFPFEIKLRNVTPQTGYCENAAGARIVLNNNSGTSETEIGVSNVAGWNRADTMGTFGATNGTSLNNGTNAYKEMDIDVYYDRGGGEVVRISEDWFGIEVLPYINPNYPIYGSNNAGFILNISDVNKKSDSSTWPAETQVQVIAKDANGSGDRFRIGLYLLSISY